MDLDNYVESVTELRQRGSTPFIRKAEKCIKKVKHFFSGSPVLEEEIQQSQIKPEPEPEVPDNPLDIKNIGKPKSDPAEDSPQLFKTVIPVNVSRQKLGYSEDLLLLYMYMEKYLNDLINLLSPLDDSEFPTCELSSQHAEIMIPHLAYENHIETKTLALIRKRKKLLQLLPKFTNKLREQHHIWVDELILLDVITEGPHGDAVRAVDKETGKFYALKRLKKTKDWPLVCFELHSLKELLTFVSGYFKDDPELIRLYAFEYEPIKNEFYMVVEFGRGTLKEFQGFFEKHNTNLSPSLILHLIDDVVNQVNKLKSIDFYHRDIKPDNIIITDDWRLKLRDYSCCCKSEGTGNRRLGISGTPYYMAPELRDAWYSGKVFLEYNPYKTDLYSVGKTFLTLLTRCTENIDSQLKELGDRYGMKVYEAIIKLMQDREPPAKPEEGETLSDFVSLHHDECVQYWRRKLLERFLEQDIFIKNKEVFILNLGNVEEFLLEWLKAWSHRSDTENFKILLSLAQYYKEVNRLDECNEYILRLKKKFSKDDKELYVCFLRIKADYFAKTERYGEAFTAYKKIKRIHSQTNKEDDLFLAEVLVEMAHILKLEGEYTRAIRKLLQVLRLYTNHYGQVHPKLAHLSELIGDLYEAQENYPQAQKLYIKALKRYLMCYGELHPLVGLMYAKVGLIHMKNKEWKESLKNLRKALDIHKKVSGPTSADVAGMYGHIGNLYRHQELYTEALTSYHKSLSMYYNYHKNSPEIAIICEHIASVHEKKGELDESLSYFGQALRLRKKLFGERNSEVVNTYCNLGDIYRKMNKMDDSIQMYANALDIGLRIFSEADPRLARIFYGIAEYYKQLGMGQKAINNFTKALHMYQHKPERLYQKIARCYLNIGHIYEQGGKEAEAEKNYQHALEVLEKHQKGDTVEKAVVYGCLGTIHEKLFDPTQAIHDFLKAIDIYDKLGKNYEPKVAYFYELVGDAYKEKRDLMNSFKYYKKSLDIKVKSMKTMTEMDAMIMMNAKVGFSKES